MENLFKKLIVTLSENSWPKVKTIWSINGMYTNIRRENVSYRNYGTDFILSI